MTVRYSPAEIGVLASAFDPLRAPGTDWTPFDPELDDDVDPDDAWDDARGEMTAAAFAAIGLALLACLFALVIGRAVRRFAAAKES